MPGSLGRSPDRWVQGEAHSLPGDSRGRCPLPKPSAEPTTTEAERVVIVGYNRASPAVKLATSGLASLRFFLLSLRLRLHYEFNLGYKGRRRCVNRCYSCCRIQLPEGYRLPRPLSRWFGNKGKEKRRGDKPTVPHLDSPDLRSRIYWFRQQFQVGHASWSGTVSRSA